MSAKMQPPASITDQLRESREALRLARGRATIYESALRAIASCDTRYPGDVVDIAQKALQHGRPL